MGIGIIGKALAGAGAAVQPVAMEGLRASIMAERDARLREYNASDRIAGQEFTAAQNELNRNADISRTSATLASHEREGKLGRESHERIAKANAAKTIASNDAGEMFYMEKGNPVFLTDPRTGKTMVGTKDLSAGSKAYLGILSEQAKAINADSLLTAEEKMSQLKPIQDRIEQVIGGKANSTPPSGSSYKSLWDGSAKDSDPQSTAITDFANKSETREKLPSVLPGQFNLSKNTSEKTAPETKDEKAITLASGYIKQRPRSNSYFIEAPPRSLLAKLKDKPFGSRDEAIQAIREIYGAK